MPMKDRQREGVRKLYQERVPNSGQPTYIFYGLWFAECVDDTTVEASHPLS